jgi:hypothetical protein
MLSGMDIVSIECCEGGEFSIELIVEQESMGCKCKFFPTEAFPLVAAHGVDQTGYSFHTISLAVNEANDQASDAADNRHRWIASSIASGGCTNWLRDRFSAETVLSNNRLMSESNSSNSNIFRENILTTPKICVIMVFAR